MQVYPPKSECEVDIVAELYEVIKQILEEDGKGYTDGHNGRLELCGWR